MKLKSAMFTALAMMLMAVVAIAEVPVGTWKMEIPQGEFIFTITEKDGNLRGKFESADGKKKKTGTLISWSMDVEATPSAAPSQQFAMAAPLEESISSSDTKPERSSRRGSRDEVFSRLARTNRWHRAANTPLRRLQAAAIDRAMADEVDAAEMQRDTIVSRRTRRVRR